MSTPIWDQHYASGEPLPWDSGRPDDQLVELWNAGRLPKGRVLEIGCGTGTNSVWLAKQGCDVTGVDLSPTAIARARARAGEANVGCQFEVRDILRDELRTTVDFVFDRGCFHVFDLPEQRATFARKVADALRPGGMWLSLIGSTEGAPRESGPPRRSARDVVNALEPVLRIVELGAGEFDRESFSAASWICLAARREMPAQPSTSRGD